MGPIRGPIFALFKDMQKLCTYFRVLFLILNYNILSRKSKVIK